MAVMAVHLAQTEPDALSAICVGIVGALALFCGVYFLYAAWLLKSLRSHRFVQMSATLHLVAAVALFLPMILIAIWPVIVLNRTEVRMFFDRPPTAPQKST